MTEKTSQASDEFYKSYSDVAYDRLVREKHTEEEAAELALEYLAAVEQELAERSVGTLSQKTEPVRAKALAAAG